MKKSQRHAAASSGFGRPISVSLTLRHLAFLDARRGHGGHVSRSAALRQALDRLMDLEAAAQPEQATH